MRRDEPDTGAWGKHTKPKNSVEIDLGLKAVDTYPCTVIVLSNFKGIAVRKRYMSTPTGWVDSRGYKVDDASLAGRLSQLKTLHKEYHPNG